ncbi:uncharacterized protein BO97DRAFT_469400 [Aspergillus homomorphus CBS 101889]|uniref:PPM-type phosphatase domain-containing protein n=1 Tax=Aspergillus homomorphus (strain CBS 101889) TaxID=1450537 RepID=A0A395I376_ASPHC|nr:hypothetical protein BO97DRAFT_469400 [Aspergillus homomorphus CBS 101889]RAL14149.1 hypothetical protein BO97DRAFT_469400 [Aspergillus homomorphus CBS 101889]
MADTLDYPKALILKDSGGSSAQGSRPSQQDKYTILSPEEFWSKNDQLALFAVYDGHGSSKVAIHARENIPKYIKESAELETGDYEGAITEAIRKEEQQLLHEFWEGEDKHALAGTTMALCLVNLTRGVLVVANVGDSDVMLGEEREGAEMQVTRLSTTHKPESDGEKHRVELAGGSVNSESGTARVGTLNMSRALGDLRYKNPLNNMTERGKMAGHEGENPGNSKSRGDFISSEPALNRVELQADRRYLLALLSDGVTNVLDDAAIINRISELKQSGFNAKRVAENLTEGTTVLPGSDNATCVTVFLEGPKFDLCHCTPLKMFENIVTPQLRVRQQLPPPAFGTLATSNIIDIRADKGETQLRQSLQETIEAACHGKAAMPDLLLWDEQGLRYFEDVTYSPSYYLTNEEIGLLEKHKYQIAERIPSGSMLVELGSGNLRKVKILLDALDELGHEVDYFALDVSFTELQRTLSMVPPGIFRHVRCFGLLGTYDDGREWLQQSDIRSRPKTILSLGSTLGSFQRADAAGFLASFVHTEAGKGSSPSFLIGLDGCMDRERVLAAYNDPEGVNRRFIKHGLERANEALEREAFELDRWDVVGHWDAENGSHDQFYFPTDSVSLAGATIPAGRRILAVQSHKYDAEDRNTLCRRAGLEEVDGWASGSQYHLLFLRS